MRAPETMNAFALSLVAIGLTLAAAPVGAQETGQTSFTLETHTDGGGGYYLIEGQTSRNPTLVVPASATITVTLKGTDDGVHNFQVDGSPASDYVQGAGQVVTYTFTSPGSGGKQYWCVPHKGAGMIGTVRVAGSAAGEDGGKESPGVATIGALLAVAGAALLVARRRS